MDNKTGKTIDCLFIGHNEIPFRQYVRSVKTMGKHSGAYRDLNLNFITYNNKPYTVAEIFNLFNCSENCSPNSSNAYKPLRAGAVFSAGIAYLGTYLNRRGYTFDYVSSFQDEKDELAQKLAGEDIRTIAIITTFYVSAFPILEIMEFIKKYNQTAKIIIGGPFIFTKYRSLDTAELEYLFKVTIGSDIYVISSQGEATLVKIIHSLKNNLPLDQVSNIYFKAGDIYKSTPVQGENNKLSANMVDWSLFQNRVGELINVRTSISCPFTCAFCGFPERAGEYQTVEVEKIEEELNVLKKIRTVKTLTFIDDTFNIPRERFKKILRMMIKNKYRFKWHSNFRCQYADREMIELMRESGCEGVFLGIESGNNQILKNMNKAASVEKYIEGIGLLKEFQIFTMGSFIIGFPGETDETARDTLNFIKESKIDFFQAQQWYCEPITPIYRQSHKYDIKGASFEWSHSTMDSVKAAEWVEEIFSNVEESIWIPQYNFSFNIVWHLLLRGMSPEKVKRFLRSFRNGIKEKLINPSQREISFEVINRLKEFSTIKNENDDFDDLGIKELRAVNREGVKFNF